ncbi:MAG: hypothetical protein QNJ32_23610 [Xenococcaceae cyanobacterium MO_167.B27]|nr:hypothetical protein [Xenococcaceae cyanobacterium MO_167.B27]
MSFFRQYISPLIILIMFLVALVAVSSRAFLPSDLASPAPVSSEELGMTLNNSTNLMATSGSLGFKFFDD